MTKVSRIIWGLIIFGGTTLTFLLPLVFSASQQALENRPTLDTPARRALAKEREEAWLNKRVNHPACPNCFKIAGGPPGIYEKVLGTDHIISRDLPDSTPLEPGEVRPDRHPETGEPLWYKGNQAFVGPTDEENVSDNLRVPLIEVMRIKYRHEDKFFKLRGVHGVGIGVNGIVVSILPGSDSDRIHIPPSLEGIPVVIEEREPPFQQSHANT